MNDLLAKIEEIEVGYRYWFGPNQGYVIPLLDAHTPVQIYRGNGILVDEHIKFPGHLPMLDTYSYPHYLQAGEPTKVKIIRILPYVENPEQLSLSYECT